MGADREAHGSLIPRVPGTGVRVLAGLKISTLTLTPLYPTCYPPGFTLPVTIPSNNKGFEVKVIDEEQEVGNGESEEAEGKELEDNELCGLQWWGVDKRTV